MKQYRITSADFYTPGDTLDPDAVLSPEDLAMVQQLTGSVLPILGPTEVKQSPILIERKYN